VTKQKTPPTTPTHGQRWGNERWR